MHINSTFIPTHRGGKSANIVFLDRNTDTVLKNTKVEVLIQLCYSGKSEKVMVL